MRVRKQLTDNFMNPCDMNMELNSFVVPGHSLPTISQSARVPSYLLCPLL